MPDLKEVLKDKTNYSDNLAWQLGNGVTVTLGQLRSLGADELSAITKKEKELSDAQARFTAQQEEFKKSQVTTANLYLALQKVAEGLRSGRTDVFDDPSVRELFRGTTPPGTTVNTDPFAALSSLESDNLLGPLVKVIRRVSEDAKKAQDAVNQNVEIQKRMATNYMNGVLEDRYDRVVPRDKQDKITLEALIQHAVRNNQYSNDSTPNIRWAFRELTAGDTAAAREAEIRSDERKKVEKELAEKAAAAGGGTGAGDIFVPVPKNFGLDVLNRSGAAPKPFASLDAAFEAAAKDATLWNQVDQSVS